MDQTIPLENIQNIKKEEWQECKSKNYWVSFV